MKAMDSLKKSRDNDERQGKDSAEQSSLEITSSPSIKSKPVFKDVISASVMDGSRGFALFAVVAVCTCMTVISFLLILQYDTPLGETPPSYNMFSSESAPKDQCAPDRLPRWAALIHKQIQVIQNLVHASLLGGAGFVAAFRGDAVWLYFARNCCFFFGLAALSYLAVDVAKGQYTTTSFIMSALMTLCCVAACVPLEFVRQEVVEHVMRYTRGHESNYPPNLPSTRCQLIQTTLIARMTDCLQVVAILYTALTTLAAIMEKECASTTSISLLEMSYREGAHQAFLLSLLFLVTTYPGDQSCVGGAVICSAWRLTLGLSYLCSISSFSFTTRETVSLASTILEIALMLPIFVSSLLLSRENSQSSQGGPSAGNVKYTKLEECHGDDDDMHEHADEFEGESDVPDNFVRRIQSLSMLQISKSMNYSSGQRRGAFIMWLSSASLLAGMTMECILLIGFSSNSFEVYQWGMHVAAMYLFCTHMSVNSVEVYNRSRYLLAIACPTGSIIAGWQLWQLFSTTFYFDYWTTSAAILFGWRALSGVGQAVGLGLLHTTEPHSVVVFDPVPSNELAGRLSKARFVLYTIYIPALFLVVVAQAFFTACSEPLISPSTPECANNNSVFLLAKYWPGLGTFFHFGGLLVIFSSDALAGAGYPPSLAIGSLFAAHITILLAGDLLFDVFVPWPMDVVGEVQLFLKAMWMLAVGWLWILLHRLWKLRIAED